MAERIKVLHIVTRMNVGGVAVLIDNLLENIDPNKFEVQLLCGNCEYPEGDYLDSKVFNYTRIRPSRFHKSFNFQDDLLAAYSIYKAIKDFKPNIVHTHTSKAGFLGRIIARLISPKIKIIHTYHGHLLYGYFSKLKLALLVFTEKSLNKLTNSVIAMGTQVKNDLVQAKIAPESKFRIFFPGLAHAKKIDRSVARKQLNFKEESIICTFVGRLTQVKRPDRFLEVVALSHDQNNKIEFIVVGDGDLAEDLKLNAINRQLPISFLGWRTDISTILSASDMLILTSDNEAVALTLIEASQLGIPIVTTPAGSVQDIAKNGVNGYVTDFDPQSLANAVEKLAINESLRGSMGAAGESIATQKFSIESMVKAHENLYLDILK